jgi:hypothetical protein
MSMSEAQLRAIMSPPVHMAQVVMPTDAAKAEVEKVRAMEVRRDAARIAGQLFAGKAPTPTKFLAMAKVVELYIEGGASEADPSARL